MIEYSYPKRGMESMYGHYHSGPSLTGGYTKRLPRSGGLWESHLHQTGIPWRQHQYEETYYEYYHNTKHNYEVRALRRPIRKKIGFIAFHHS